MDAVKRHSTDEILTLTLEILYLLTGEDYIVVRKTSEECVAPSRLGGWSRARCPKMEPPLLMPERNNEKKVLDLTYKMVKLLTGEVPIRCQDVAVYFSMEEWEYVEGHKDLYQDSTMEDHRPLESPDGSSKIKSPKRCRAPLDSKDCPGEELSELQDDQDEDLIHVKVEFTEEDEADLMSDDLKEEEFNVYIGPDGSTRSPSERCSMPLYAQDCPERDHNVHEDLQDEDLIDLKVEVMEEEESSWDDGPYIEEEASTTLCTEYEREGGNVMQDSGGDHAITSAVSQLYLFSTDRSSDVSNVDSFLDQPYLASQISEQSVGELYSCSECEKCFVFKSKLLIHMKTHRKKKKFLCSECGIYFPSKSSLDEHHKIHTEERVSSIVQHPVSHMAETSFHCSDCGEHFADRLVLLNHQRNHMGLKTFRCSECGKYFSLKSALVRHQRIHTGEKPFPCYECWKFFSVKSNLVKHQRIHTGEKPFLCSECGKRFTQKPHFIKHQRTHTGEKPYPCSDCGKRFSQKPHLEKHKRSHTGERPFVCSDCGRCFTGKQILLKHQRVHMS
ncbi:oocyte zinc finger protein XlCOF7.1-like [Dendropsophus ebraccatus]|uniref:oocyte zinc finger protein XlCOF7.1-like n=1 Tax=Dendropsophus ebraccatus TaxID=150705 RepID=UPI0038320DB5